MSPMMKTRVFQEGRVIHVMWFQALDHLRDCRFSEESWRSCWIIFLLDHPAYLFGSNGGGNLSFCDDDQHEYLVSSAAMCSCVFGV